MGRLRIKDSLFSGEGIDIDVDVSLSSSVADIAEPQTRQGTVSKTVNIWATPQINNILTHIYEINKEITNISGQFNPDFNPNKKANIEYFEDGVLILTGYMRLIRIVKDLNTSKIVYECQLLNDIADFWKDLTQKKMADIDLTQYNHNLNYNLIRKSWDQNIVENGVQVPFQLGKGYIHGLINKKISIGGIDPTSLWDEGDTTPMIYAKELIDAIYLDAGKSYVSGGFFDSTEFKKWVVPYNGKGLGTTDAVINQYKAIASNTLSLYYPYNLGTFQCDGFVIMDDDSTPPNQDLSGAYNPATGEYTIPYNGTYTLTSTFELTITYPVATVVHTLNGYVMVVNTTNGTYRQLPFSTAIPAGITSYTFAIVLSSQFDASLGDVIKVSIATQTAGTFRIHDLYINAGSFFEIKPSALSYSNGSLVNFTNFFDSKLTQKDFYLDVIKTFNLYVDIDELGNHIVETRDEYYSSDVIDLNEYINADTSVVYEPMGALDANPYVLTYTKDTDSLNELYFNTNNEAYGTHTFQIDNDFVTNTKEIKVGYSAPCMQYFGGTAMSLVSIVYLDKSGNIDKGKNPNYRFLRYAGMKGCNPYNIMDNGVPFNINAYPLIGHIDDTNAPTIDGMFGILNQHYLKPTIKYSANNLWYNYHIRLYNEITDKNSKIVTVALNIPPDLYYNMKFWKLYWFDNSYFRLNKITDYKENANTLCEFIKIIEYTKPTITGSTGNGGTDEITGTGEFYPTGLIIEQPRSNQGQAVGNNNTLNADSFAVGDNNLSLGVGSFVNSSDCIVALGVTATLVNCNGITATQDGLYINDVLYVAGGSLATDTFWDAAGDLAVGSGVDAAARLPIGTTLQYLRVNAAATDLEWATLGAGAGDMVLASAQTNIGIKTFLDTTLKLRNVANTFDGYFVNTNTADRIYTLQDAAGTIAFTSDITGINSGTNTGDNSVNTLYSGLAASKQDTLVSATNIKTINGSTILGAGDLIVGSEQTILTLAGDQSTAANTTPITLTSMAFDYEINSVYQIEILGFVQPTAATTGCGFIIDVSTAVTKIGLSFFHQLATSGTLSGGSLIADNAVIGVSSGMPNTGITFVQGKGVLITDVNIGTAQFKFRSEVAAVTTIKADTKFIITKLS